VTNNNLIKQLEELKTELFDTESNLLASLGTNHNSTDYYGNKMRRIAKLREQQKTLVRAISYIQAVEAALV